MSTTDDSATEALAEAEAVLRLLESESGSTESVMEGFATRVKSTGTLPTVTPNQAIDLMHNPTHSHHNVICLDARTPNEYDQGHIPGAYNLPLFSNQERITVGTLFKKAGRGTAMTAGIEVVRPKFQALVEQAQALMAAHLGGTDMSTSSTSSTSSSTSATTKSSTTTTTATTTATTATPPPTIIVHCWRGGMRSHALAYLLQTRTTIRTVVLSGGYKAFRKWARMVYCYLPVNASYTCAVAAPNTGKRKRDLQRLKNKSKKKNQKKQAKLSTLTDDGLEKRRLALEKREQMLAAEDKRLEEQRIADEEVARLAWSNEYRTGPKVAIVGGRSGSGKTRVLLAMRDQLGQQVLDLEGLAHHNGSAFGFVGHGHQPTNQQFGNNVAVEWSKLDPNRTCVVLFLLVCWWCWCWWSLSFFLLF